MSQATKKQELEQYEAYQAYCKEIQAAESIKDTAALSENEEEKQARIGAYFDTKNDGYVKFIDRYGKSVARDPPAWFHIEAANVIFENDRLKAVFEWSRFMAKSSTITLLVVLWLAVAKKFKMGLLVSKTETAAQKFLSKIFAHLSTNKKLIRDFDIKIISGSWKSTDITFSIGDHKINIRAIGIGQTPRSASSDESYRPDLVIPDDVDEDEMCENPERIKKAVKWMKGALFGSMDAGRGRYLQVGNRIHVNSVLANIVNGGGIDYHSKVNILDDEGNPAWKEKHSLEEVMDTIKFMGDEAETELFNNPSEGGEIWQDEDFRWKHMPALHEYPCGVSYTDPSWKGTKGADSKSCIFIAPWQGEIHIRKAFCRTSDMAALIGFTYHLQENIIPSSLMVRHSMEANFAQDLLLEDYTRWSIKHKKKQLVIHKDLRSKPPKLLRMANMHGIFTQGLVWFDIEEKENPDMQTLIKHFKNVGKGGKRYKVDGADAFEGAYHELQELLQLISVTPGDDINEGEFEQDDERMLR